MGSAMGRRQRLKEEDYVYQRPSCASRQIKCKWGMCCEMTKRIMDQSVGRKVRSSGGFGTHVADHEKGELY